MLAAPSRQANSVSISPWTKTTRRGVASGKASASAAGPGVTTRPSTRTDIGSWRSLPSALERVAHQAVDGASTALPRARGGQLALGRGQPAAEQRPGARPEERGAAPQQRVDAVGDRVVDQLRGAAGPVPLKTRWAIARWIAPMPPTAPASSRKARSLSAPPRPDAS